MNTQKWKLKHQVRPKKYILDILCILWVESLYVCVRMCYLTPPKLYGISDAKYIYFLIAMTRVIFSQKTIFEKTFSGEGVIIINKNDYLDFLLSYLRFFSGEGYFLVRFLFYFVKWDFASGFIHLVILNTKFKCTIM